MSNIFADIVKVFDAKFHPNSLAKHYERHNDGSSTRLPSGMSMKEYDRKSEYLSLQKIDGKNVRAYKYRGNRIAKCNGRWFTSYADGKNSGNITTCFPASMSQFESWMKRDNGVEIFEER